MSDQSDDAIQDLLGALDPARDLPPVDAAALAERLEETMSQPTSETSITSASRRPRRTNLILGAAAATVALAVGTGVVVSQGNDDKAAPTTTKLTVGPTVEAKCKVPSADDVAGQEIAVEGTVVSIEDGLVTLDPSTFYKGTATDLVTVDEPDLGMSEMPVEFVVGKKYIVGATGGFVSICGLSGPATEELRALYDEAFGR